MSVLFPLFLPGDECPVSRCSIIFRKQFPVCRLAFIKLLCKRASCFSKYFLQSPRYYRGMPPKDITLGGCRGASASNLISFEDQVLSEGMPD